MPEQALAGVRVLDFSEYVAGPFCTKLLADFGAEVIKVERPGLGDVARGYGPFKGDVVDREASGLFLYCNTNKKSVTLDVETASGREIARRLAAECDLVVESWAPGRASALGIGWAELSVGRAGGGPPNPPRMSSFDSAQDERLRQPRGRGAAQDERPGGPRGGEPSRPPRMSSFDPAQDERPGGPRGGQGRPLVMLSISMFGQDGPWRDWKSDEVNLHAVSGLMSITGDPGREPLKNGGHQALYNTGINAFTAATIALYAQMTLGVGQHVDVSAYETMTYLVEPPRVLQASQQGDFINRVGNRATLLPCADGHVNLIRGGSGVFVEVLAKMTGDEGFLAPELRNAPLAGPAASEAADTVEALILPWLLEHTKEEFYHGGQGGGQNFGYVASPADLVASPQLRDRGFFVDVDHPRAGKLTYPGAPFRMSETPWRSGRAPLLGEHNAEVYGGLGFSAQDLVGLSRAGVV